MSSLGRNCGYKNVVHKPRTEIYLKNKPENKKNGTIFVSYLRNFYIFAKRMIK